jgi:hypothetical protein
MKGKTPLKIRIPIVRINPNIPQRAQKWKYYFESFAKIDKKYDLKIGKSILHIEPVSNELIKGYYEFSFLERQFINRKKAEDIAKKDFEYYDKALALKGNLGIAPRWKRLVCLNSSEFEKPRFRTIQGGFVYNIVPPYLSKDVIESFPTLLMKIAKSDQKMNIIQCLNWMNRESKSDIERFLFMWIAFNILYTTKYPTSKDTEAIENFSRYGIEYKKISQVLLDHADIIKKMTELRLLSRTKVNQSKELKKALKKGKVIDILKHSLLCAWIIRGDLFHKGKQYDIFLSNLANYLKAIIKLGILKII